MKIFQKPSKVVGEYPTKTKWYLSNAKLFQLRRKARAAKPRTKWYLIGDPVIREKIRDGARVAYLSFIHAFAMIGIGSTIAYVWLVLR